MTEVFNELRATGPFFIAYLFQTPEGDQEYGNKVIVDHPLVWLKFQREGLEGPGSIVLLNWKELRGLSNTDVAEMNRQLQNQ